MEKEETKKKGGNKKTWLCGVGIYRAQIPMS